MALRGRALSGGLPCLAVLVLALGLAACGGGGDGQEGSGDLEAIRTCLEDSGLAVAGVPPKVEAEGEFGEGEAGEEKAAELEGALVITLDTGIARVEVFASEGAAEEAFNALQPLLEHQGQGIEHSANRVLSSTKDASDSGLEQVRSCAT